MFLRKLTDEELARIKKAKDTANKAIKARRKKLAEEIKQRHKYRPTFKDVKLRSLGQQLEKTQPVIGHPVIITVGDQHLFMNYDLLKKFERSFNRGDLWTNDLKIEGNSLIIKYKNFPNRGTVELYELPAYQVELLTGLPSIDLKE